MFKDYAGCQFACPNLPAQPNINCQLTPRLLCIWSYLLYISHLEASNHKISKANCYSFSLYSTEHCFRQYLSFIHLSFFKNTYISKNVSKFEVKVLFGPKYLDPNILCSKFFLIRFLFSKQNCFNNICGTQIIEN